MLTFLRTMNIMIYLRLLFIFCLINDFSFRFFYFYFYYVLFLYWYLFSNFLSSIWNTIFHCSWCAIFCRCLSVHSCSSTWWGSSVVLGCVVSCLLGIPYLVSLLLCITKVLWSNLNVSLRYSACNVMSNIFFIVISCIYIYGAG